MEPMPVHRRPALAGGNLQQHAADAVLGAGAVLVDADREGPDAEGFGGGFGMEFDGDWAADGHFGCGLLGGWVVGCGCGFGWWLFPRVV